jgi:hypothetical protein
MPSVGTLGAAIVVLNVGGFGFAAYQCEQDAKLDKRVAEMPVFGSVVMATKDILRTAGITKAPVVSNNKGIQQDAAASKISPTVVKSVKKAAEKSKANTDMKAAIEASRVKKEEKKVAPIMVKDEGASAAEKPAAAAAAAVKEESEPEPVVVMQEPVKAAEEEEKRDQSTAAATTNTSASISTSTSTSTRESSIFTKDYSTLPAVPAEAKAMALSADMNRAVGAVMEDLNHQTIELRKELEATLLSDLDKLDAPALRTRCTQLAAEFFERTKWEGVRLHSNVKQVKSELGKKYSDRMAEQRAELELELNKRILEREADLMAQASVAAKEQLQAQEEAFEHALKEQAQGFTNQITKALEHQSNEIREEVSIKANNEIATMRDEHVKQQVEVLQRIGQLGAQVNAFEGFADKIAGLTSDSANAHRFSAAVMTLESVLQNNNPMGSAVKNVKAYCGNDPLVMTLSNSLPASLLNSGAPSMLELKIRFQVVKEHVRSSAFAPEGLPEMVGQAVGSVLSKLYWAPSGPVEGAGAEEVLSRASHALDQGQLGVALKELDGIKGYGQTILADWSNNARNRLIADQAVKVLKAGAVIKHQQLGYKEKK